jgi:hypothetical protein
MANYLPGLTLNHNPPDLSLLSSLDYRSEPLVPGSVNAFPIQQLARAHKRLILNYILMFIIISESKTNLQRILLSSSSEFHCTFGTESISSKALKDSFPTLTTPSTFHC